MCGRGGTAALCPDVGFAAEPIAPGEMAPSADDSSLPVGWIRVGDRTNSARTRPRHPSPIRRLGHARCVACRRPAASPHRPAAAFPSLPISGLTCAGHRRGCSPASSRSSSCCSSPGSSNCVIGRCGAIQHPRLNAVAEPAPKTFDSTIELGHLQRCGPASCRSSSFRSSPALPTASSGDAMRSSHLRLNAASGARFKKIGS
jgi:hypothetical protein